MRVNIHERSIALNDADQARDAALQARVEAEVAVRKRQVQAAQF